MSRGSRGEWEIGSSHLPATRSDKRRTVHNRRGQAYTETVIVLPILLIIIAGIIGFGQLLYVKLGVEAAAWASARHAVASLDQDRAVGQAFRASRYALEGFGLNPNSADVQIVVWGQWGRATQIRAEVCYDVPSPPVPLGESIIPRRICARQTMPVYRWKARW